MSKHLCRHCGGSGHVKCPRCDGTGKLGKDTCYACDGDRVVECPVCHGEKYVEDDD